MKRPLLKKFTLLNGIILSVTAAHADSCTGPRYRVVSVDPCNAHTFEARACERAIDQHGYYWQGSFYPVYYPQPYLFYYDSWGLFVRQGGISYSAPLFDYDAHYVTYDSRISSFNSRITSSSGSYLSSARTSGLVSRGGFGATGRGFASAAS